MHNNSNTYPDSHSRTWSCTRSRASARIWISVGRKQWGSRSARRRVQFCLLQQLHWSLECWSCTYLPWRARLPNWFRPW